MHARAIRQIDEAARVARSLKELAETVLPTFVRASGAHAGALFQFAPGAPTYHHSASLAFVDIERWANRYAGADPYLHASIRRNLELDLSAAQVEPARGPRVTAMREFFMPIGCHDWVIARLNDAPNGSFGNCGMF